MDTTREATPSYLWIENLALDELNMNEKGTINMQNAISPASRFEESSIELMNTLKKRTQILVDKFNDYQKEPISQIKIFKISNTINDFMLFRNSLRLVFSRKSNDRIIVGFMIYGKEISTAKASDQKNFYEVRGKMGAFNQINWYFENEAIDVNSLLKYFISEFIISSVR